MSILTMILIDNDDCCLLACFLFEYCIRRCQ